MQSAAAELAGSPQGKTDLTHLLINLFVLFLEPIKENKTFWLNHPPKTNSSLLIKEND